MQINFRWGAVLATETEKEAIETAIKDDLRTHCPIVLPDDSSINITLFPDEPRDFKILGVAKNNQGQFLFRFSTSSMTASLRIAYDFSKELPTSS